VAAPEASAADDRADVRARCATGGQDGGRGLLSVAPAAAPATHTGYGDGYGDPGCFRCGEARELRTSCGDHTGG
jgi:hypothetical protein